MAADPGRSDAEALQLGRGNLITHVQRLGDERRLLKLGLLDAGERTAIGNAAALRGGDQLRIDLLAGERSLDQRLPLLDHPGARLGGCRQADRLGRGGGIGTRDQPRGRIAGPGDQSEQHQKKHRLERR